MYCLPSLQEIVVLVAIAKIMLAVPKECTIYFFKAWAFPSLFF
jgi:hypothetical protein